MKKKKWMIGVGLAMLLCIVLVVGIVFSFSPKDNSVATGLAGAEKDTKKQVDSTEEKEQTDSPEDDTDRIYIKGTEDMICHHDGGEVAIQEITITEFFVSVSADVTNLHYEEDAYAQQTSLPVTIHTTDAGDMVVCSHNPEKSENLYAAYDSFDHPLNQELLTSHYEFQDMMDIHNIVGITVEDCYIPIERK